MAKQGKEEFRRLHDQELEYWRQRGEPIAFQVDAMDADWLHEIRRRRLAAERQAGEPPTAPPGSNP